MKQILISLLFTLSASAIAQTSKVNNTKWATEEKSVILLTVKNNVCTGTQIEGKTEKYIKNNGKTVLRDFKQINEWEFAGTIINNQSGSEYEGHLIVNPDLQTATLKVKYGFLRINRNWKRVD